MKELCNSACFSLVYGSEGYYDQHWSLELVTPEDSYRLQVFSSYVMPGDSDIYQLTCRDGADFEDYLKKPPAVGFYHRCGGFTPGPDRDPGHLHLRL